jgi:hypothetical protein
MSWVAAATIGSAVIGGVSSRKASKDAQKGVERGQDILKEAVERGRSDILSRFPEVQAAIGQGFGESRNLLAGTAFPGQVGAFQQGNLQAQEAIQAGLPQQINAIMGLPVDLTGLQPRQISVDPNMFQAQLAATQEQRAAAPQEPPTQLTPEQIESIRQRISGGFLGGAGPQAGLPPRRMF